MQDDKYFLFKLSNIEGFGPVTINIILNKFKALNKSLSEFFKLSQKEFYDLFPEFVKGRFSKVRFEQISNLNDELIVKEYVYLQKSDTKIITIFNKNYPKSIIEKFGNSPPPILYCKGRVSLLRKKSVAIVGSRNNVDDRILKITREIAKQLVDNRYNIISGYAKGVDINAHLGALDCGGSTTCVLSCGINKTPSRKEMKEKYTWKNILFVSQFRPDERWRAQNAMIRNKLVCALSKAVVVIQSGPPKNKNEKMSGTYDAAETALNFNIPLLVLSPKFFPYKPIGNTQLLKKPGAKEITDPQKVAELIKSDKRDNSIQMNLFNVKK